MKRFLIGLCFAAVLVLPVAAQTTPTPAPAFGPIVTQTPLPTLTPVPVDPSDDPRLALCSAPALPNFVPYVVRHGDQITDLMIGVDFLTATQLAGLNCLDNPAGLPLNAVVWIPASSFVGQTLRPFGTGSTDPVEGVAVTPEAEATAESTPASEPPETTRADAEIDSFEAVEETIYNQSGTVVRWRATGSAAYLFLCPVANGAFCVRPANAASMPLDGEIALTDFVAPGTYRLRLQVWNEFSVVEQDLTFEVVCSQLALVSLPGACLEEAPQSVFMVEQSFEYGRMLYFSDTAQIYVLTDDGQVQVFSDTFAEGIEEPELDVPEGLFPAVRGFGIVWRELGAENGPLGWGVRQEVGYDGQRQPAGRLSYTTYILGFEGLIYALTEVPGGARYWSMLLMPE